MQLEPINSLRALQDKLDAVTAERDALVTLLSDQPIFQARIRQATPADDLEGSVTGSRLQEELARLQQGRDELTNRLAREEQERADAKRRIEELEGRLSASTAELDSLKSELDKHVVDRASLEAELRERLGMAQAAVDNAQAALREEIERLRHAEAEIGILRQTREELVARLDSDRASLDQSRRDTGELEARLQTTATELERLAALLEQQVAELGSIEPRLAEQLREAKLASEHADGAYREEVARVGILEAELERLGRTREELDAKLADEGRIATEARQRSVLFEQRVSESTAELERIKGELERHTAERASAELQLQNQLTAAKHAAEQVKDEYREETTLLQRSSIEAEALRRIRDELNARLETEQQVAAASRSQTERLESRLTELGKQLDTARDSALKAETAYQEEVLRSIRLEQALDQLRSAKAEGHSKTQSKYAFEAQARITELEGKLQCVTTELNRAKRDVAKSSQRAGAGTNIGAMDELEKERAERRRLEQRVSMLSGQLQALHEQTRTHLESERACQQRITDLEEQLLSSASTSGPKTVRKSFRKAA